MKKSKKISLDNVGRMCKSGGVITTNITAKRLTTPVGFLNDSTELDTTTNKFGQFDRIGPTSGWSLLELKHLKVKNCNLKKTKNRSKSIFREIDKKYFENFLKLPQFPLRIIGDFTKKLTKQLHNNINNNKNWKDLNYYKQQINNEIVRIDKILHRSINIKASLLTKKMATTTTTTTTSNGKNRKRQICNDGNNENNNDDNNKENIPMKYPFIPSTNWVFQTPPNRKLNFNNFAKQQQDLLNDGLIQPAVLRTCNEKTIVYEMNKFINVDLTNYQNKQEIDIDRRYMTEVTNIQQQQQLFRKQQQEQDDNGRNLKVFRFDANNGDNIDQLDNPASDPYELEHHFLSLTCRPKKSISTVSRIQNIKRKRDMFFSTTTTTTTTSSTTPTSSGLSPRKQTKFHENFKMINNNNDNLEEFEASFSLINPPNQGCIEESFRFKFTTTPTGGKIGGGGGGSGNNNNNNIARLFDYDGIEKDSFTFQCDME